MKRRTAQQPIIIIGMHRSGTSMIVRLLEELGLFVGKRKDQNHEAMFFQRLNIWLFHQAGASWDKPKPLCDFLNHSEVRLLAVDYIRQLMKSPWAISYLGLGNFLRYRGIQNVDFPFGWKDPRTTFLLPLWLDVFPGAKIIHIYRHGVDVAHSLQVRQRKQLALEKVLHERRKRWFRYWFLPMQGGFVGSVRVESLEFCVSLWETYNIEARTHVNQLGKRAVEIKYEDFLAMPYESINDLAQFCCLNPRRTAIQDLATTIKSDQVYAYRRNAELCAFAESVAKQLKRGGY